MSVSSRGLGRGLDALFQNNGEAAGTSTTTAYSSAPKGATEPRKVMLSALAPNPQQPRRHFPEQQMEELAASIKSQGVLQPLLVRPMHRSADGSRDTFEIIAGERRWRAAQQAGLSAVPVVVREMNDQEVLIAALMENLQREDLTPMEEALGYQQLKEEFGLSQEDLANHLGKSRSAIANTLRLLALPEAARQDLTEGRISAGHARALLVVTDPESQEAFRQYMISSPCTVREAESIASLWKETGALPEDMVPGTKQAQPVLRKAPAPCEAILSLQERLGKALTLPVTIKGRETRGTISLKYASKEELEALLAKLGVPGDFA